MIFLSVVHAMYIKCSCCSAENVAMSSNTSLKSNWVVSTHRSYDSSLLSQNARLPNAVSVAYMSWCCWLFMLDSIGHDLWKNITKFICYG